jgi:maltokinase
VIDLATVPELLVEHLPQHLPRQRWSGAHDRAIRSVSVRWHEVVSDDDAVSLVWALVDVRFGADETGEGDGEEHTFQLFVGLRPIDQQPEFLEGKDRELIAVVPCGDDVPVILYDALVDPDLAIAVLHLVAPEVEVEVRRPLVLEHSNSSIVFDEARILKIFRRVVPGPNPDVEITRVLSQRGYEHVLAPLAELRRDDTDLAVLRDFLVGAVEGWVLARTSVRDLLASRLPPEESGGDFAHDAERLGGIIAGLHLAMADAWGSAPGEAARWGDEMEAHLRDLLRDGGLQLHPTQLDTSAVVDRYQHLGQLDDVGAQLRIHGDLHLAQVIRADTGWFVLDFEGEPARRRDERFTTSSPLRDVAGMLRSFHYAAATGLAEWVEADREPDPELVALADAWDERSRCSFLAGYLAVEGIDALLPKGDDARDAVLAAFELDKAVYEVGYELGYRPDQAAIPLAGIDRLVRAPLPS